MNRPKRIYLAGAASLGIDFAIGWRRQAGVLMPDYTIVSPFRNGKLDASAAGHIYRPHEIVTRDLQDIRGCDAVLAEMTDPNYNYIGTVSEIFYASYCMHIPVVVWSAVPKTINHYWINDLVVNIFPTLEECCDYLNHYMGD